MRLIDADALENKGIKFDTHGGATFIALGSVRTAPTIEAEPVVRCKDCRNSMLWRKPTDTVIGECLIRKMHSEDEVFCQVGADDFCSYGERRYDNGQLHSHRDRL